MLVNTKILSASDSPTNFATYVSSSGWLHPGNKLKMRTFDFCKTQTSLKDKEPFFVFPQQGFTDQVTGYQKN